MSKIVLTGGSGDLGMFLGAALTERGHEVASLDLIRPQYPINNVNYIEGSILDGDDLEAAFQDADLVIHIAGLHGIHLAQGKALKEDFDRVNVSGTENVFQSAALNGVNNILHISTSDVHDENPDAYSQSKIDAEDIARMAAKDHGMKVVSLRPRAFIPPWNESAYPDEQTRYKDWSKWFLKGAVHIQDVNQASLKIIECLFEGLYKDGQKIDKGHFETFDLDGTYLHTDEQLSELSDLGFKLVPKSQPAEWREKTENLLGYSPTYGIKEFILDWNKYAPKTPPNPFAP